MIQPNKNSLSYHLEISISFFFFVIIQVICWREIELINKPVYSLASRERISVQFNYTVNAPTDSSLHNNKTTRPVIIGLS